MAAAVEGALFQLVPIQQRRGGRRWWLLRHASETRCACKSLRIGRQQALRRLPQHAPKQVRRPVAYDAGVAGEPTGCANGETQVGLTTAAVLRFGRRGISAIFGLEQKQRAGDAPVSAPTRKLGVVHVSRRLPSPGNGRRAHLGARCRTDRVGGGESLVSARRVDGEPGRRCEAGVGGLRIL